MKIKNINKKLLAGLLGTVMLTTPLGITACENDNTKNILESTQDQGSKGSNNRTEYRYRFEYAKELKIITIESLDSNIILLVEKLDGWSAGLGEEHYYFYSDVLSDTEFKEDEVKIICEEELGDYFFAYGYLQKSYSKSELRDFFEKIKSEICIDEKSNELIKK